MGRSKETFGKKEVRNKQEKKRKEKEKRKLEKKEQEKKSGLDDMIAFVDENGNITDTPPDPSQKEEIEAEDIEIGVPKAEFRTNAKIRTGRIHKFDDAKGYGFIIDSKTGESVFVHTNDCLDAPEVGANVQFETEKGLKGTKAVNVKYV